MSTQYLQSFHSYVEQLHVESNSEDIQFFTTQTHKHLSPSMHVQIHNIVNSLKESIVQWNFHTKNSQPFLCACSCYASYIQSDWRMECIEEEVENWDHRLCHTSVLPVANHPHSWW